MNSILFPTDFSENADNALNYALRLANDFNATLHILHALQMPYSGSVPMTKKLQKALKDGAIADLKNYELKIKQNPENEGIKIVSKAVSGNVINAVDNYANDCHVDLVVMGTKGASGVKEVLIGSNAEEVVRHSDKPLLIVPEGAQEFSIKKVAVAADFKTIDNGTLFNELVSLCKKYEAAAMVVNIEKDEDSIYSARKTIEALRYDQVFSEIKHDFHFEVNTNVVKGINQFIEDHQCDLLSVVSRKHYFFDKIFHKSITNKLTCHTEIPIFVIKEN